MQVLRQSIREDFSPARFARSFERHVGLKLSHVCIVAALLAAMYVATKSYSTDSGYQSPVPPSTAITESAPTR
jgi:hypothetical protein